jgi:hypothetical protein
MLSLPSKVGHSAARGAKNTVAAPADNQLCVAIWNIQDFGTGMGRFNQYGGDIPAGLGGDGDYDLVCIHKKEKCRAASSGASNGSSSSSTQSSAPNVAASLAPPRQHIDYLDWLHEFHALADEIAKIEADVVVLLEMRTSPRSTYEQGEWVGYYMYQQLWFHGFAQAFAKNDAEKEFRKLRAPTAKEIKAVSDSELHRVNNDLRSHEQIGVGNSKADRKLRKRKTYLDWYKTDAETTFDKAVENGQMVGQEKKKSHSSGVGAAGLLTETDLAEYLDIHGKLAFAIGNDEKCAFTDAKEWLVEFLEKENAAWDKASPSVHINNDPNSAAAASSPTGASSSSSILPANNPLPDAPAQADAKYSKKLIEYVRRRLVRKHKDKNLELHYCDLPGGHGETIAVVYNTQRCKLGEVLLKQHDDETYGHRPVYLIPATIDNWFPIVLIAGHAPAASHHQEQGKEGKNKANKKTMLWFKKFNEVSHFAHSEASVHRSAARIMVGDFNFKKICNIGVVEERAKFFGQWHPSFEYHGEIETSLVMSDTKGIWCEPYDKVLIHKDDTNILRGTGDMVRGNVQSAQAGRRFSDHTWVKQTFTLPPEAAPGAGNHSLSSATSSSSGPAGAALSSPSNSSLLPAAAASLSAEPSASLMSDVDIGLPPPVPALKRINKKRSALEMTGDEDVAPNKKR